MQNTSVIRIYTLGQFRIERLSGEKWITVTDAAWQQKRVRVLLRSLVSSPRRTISRKLLLDEMRIQGECENANGRVDRAVHSLRQIFEPDRAKPATSPLLLVEQGMLILGDQQHIWVDADAFEHVIALAHTAENVTEKEHLLEEAFTLYGGDFLPEERIAEVTLSRRTRLSHCLTGLLLELAELRIQREAWTSAIEPLTYLLSLDPANEVAVQMLMRVLTRLGRRGEALRTYKHLATILQHDYQIAPLPATRTVYETVRGGTPLFSFDQVHVSITPNLAMPVRLGRTHQSPMVGRVQELEFLRGLLYATELLVNQRSSRQRQSSLSLALDTQRIPQGVLLTGEAGIGKSRLAEVFGYEARKRGWSVIWSNLYEQERVVPYRLWIDVLRSVVQLRKEVVEEDIKKRPFVYSPLAPLLPEVTRLLPSEFVSSDMLVEQEQLRIWEAIRSLLIMVAESHPVLIVIDDLHWSDSASCELFAYLVRRVSEHPVFLLATCCEQDLVPTHILHSLCTDLLRERALELLALEPLKQEQTEMLLDYFTEVVSPLSDQTLQSIHRYAAGNPFFIEELVEHFTRSSRLEEDVALPEGINALLYLNLRRVSTACQRLLERASVLGEAFPISRLYTLEQAQHNEQDMMLTLLEEALRAGLLYESATPPDIIFSFRHPLLVRYLFQRLSAARRSFLQNRLDANIPKEEVTQ